MTAPLTLVLGAEELLVERAVRSVVAAAAAEAPDTEVVTLAGEAVEAGRLAEVSAPSLFDDHRVVVLTGAETLGKDVAAELLAHAGVPAEGVALVVVHSGGARNKALVEGLRAAGAVVVQAPQVRWPEERASFVEAEVRAAGGQITAEAVRELIATVGSDLRELASAAAQLVSDHEGLIDLDVVGRYHRGRADSSGFLVADRAVEGDAAAALELLRWGLAEGLGAPLVTSALAANLRLVAQVAAAGSRPPEQVAKLIGAPPWKVKRARGWARGWRPAGVDAAVRAVARADAAVKGAAADPGYALERAVIDVVAARGLR